MATNTALMTEYEIFFADQQWLTIGDAEFDRALTLRSHHPDIRTYLEPLCFAGFRVEYGELVWGDYEPCFPVIDLYRNTIEHDQLMTKAA
jgi:hypothetical protein